MKKRVLALIYVLLFIFTSLSATSFDRRCIILTYSHSLRVPYQSISIEIRSNVKNQYYINIKTTQRPGSTGFEYSNTEREIEINKDYFDYLYSSIEKIDMSKLIKKNINILGLDGLYISLEIGNIMNKYGITLWSPKYDEKTRGTKEFNLLIEEIFTKSDLLEWLYN